MKTILIALTLIASNSMADQYVKGHYRSNGTYVEGYYRSSPNNTTSDNWSTKGNQNPYTGEYGTKTYNNDSYNFNQPKRRNYGF